MYQSASCIAPLVLGSVMILAYNSGPPFLDRYFEVGYGAESGDFTDVCISSVSVGVGRYIRYIASGPVRQIHAAPTEARRPVLVGGWPGLTHNQSAATGRHSEPPSAIPTFDLRRLGAAQPAVTGALRSGGGGQVTVAPGQVRGAAGGRRWWSPVGQPVPLTLTTAAAAAAARPRCRCWRLAAADGAAEWRAGLRHLDRQDRSSPVRTVSSGTSRGR